MKTSQVSALINKLNVCQLNDLFNHTNDCLNSETEQYQYTRFVVLKTSLGKRI